MRLPWRRGERASSLDLLVVGLGNPGTKYARHRHNVGFMAVERIAERNRFGPWKRKFHGLAADGDLAGEKVLLLKPDTYMNESGLAVGEATRFLKIPESDVVVFHDELDLAPGKIKVKAGGGNAGPSSRRSTNDSSTMRSVPAACPAAGSRWRSCTSIRCPVGL